MTLAEQHADEGVAGAVARVDDPDARGGGRASRGGRCWRTPARVATSALTRPPKELPLSSGPKSTGTIVEVGDRPAGPGRSASGRRPGPVAQAAYSSWVERSRLRMISTCTHVSAPSGGRRRRVDELHPGPHERTTYCCAVVIADVGLGGWGRLAGAGRPPLLAVGRAVVAVPIAYLSVLTAAAWGASLLRPPRRPVSLGTTRFAIVVPAHDEEAVIGDTLQAMADLDYPTERYRVHVVADHCTDRTVEIAKAAGVEVHEHVGAARGKGPALQWAITPLARRPADVVRHRRRRHDRRPGVPRRPRPPVRRRRRRPCRASTASATPAGRRAPVCAPRPSPCATTCGRSAARRSAPRRACTATGWRSRPTCCAGAPGPGT